MSTDGKLEFPLVVHSADDCILGWAPNGKSVLFASNRTGSRALWFIPGRGRENPRTSSADEDDFGLRTIPMGFSRDGRFFYGESKAASDIYTVRLDPATGKVLGSPEKIIDRFEGFNFMPSCSPDGKWLAYCSWRGGKPSPTHVNVRCMHSIETGEDQEYSKELRNLGVTSISRPRWAPHGKSIVPEPTLQFQQYRPRGYNDNGCPDKRGEEGPEDPKARSDKCTYEENSQGYTRDVP